MELKRFEVYGLFNSLDHTIDFPSTTRTSQRAAVLIIHGRNGVGKTTLLRMLDGVLRLDFNTFRHTPFREARLTFTNGKSLLVIPKKAGDVLESIYVSYAKTEAILHPAKSGPLVDADQPTVLKFREAFFSDTRGIAFEYIDIERLSRIKNSRNIEAGVERFFVGDDIFFSPTGQSIPKLNTKSKKERDTSISLDKRVAEFINSAQVNYRQFFSSTEPDLFPKIIEKLSGESPKHIGIEKLKAQFKSVRDQDKLTERLGLESDRWDYRQIISKIEMLDKHPETKQHALTVLSVYAEHLASRAQERKLVGDRLLTFEKLLSDFFAGKEVRIDSAEGMKIFTTNTPIKVTLKETDLSSGEYHLLYLMVSALVTKQKGTILAIDEPEMSMHIAWQRKLIPALIECASGAEPLFIFATHSPDLASSYSDSMIDLG